MPALTAAELALLRQSGQQTNLYLVVQQPMHRSKDAWTGYVWSCQINGAPAGTPGDLVASLTVDNGDPAATLYDGMTVFVGSTLGAHDRGVFYIRDDQNVNAGTVALDIGATAEVVGVLQDDDYVVVLSEYRIWRRDPRITEAGGALTWYKDYDRTYAALGANDPQRRQASLPPVPIMGPHRVAFLNPGSSVDLTFDWSASYATSPGAAVDDWDSWGEDGAGGWNVNNDATPPPQTYSNVSGLAGYSVRLEISHDQQDPPTPFRRGFRFVFTLRHPGQTQAGDPSNAEPITDFEVQSVAGSFDQGFWRATIRVYGDAASEYEITPGALILLFAEDWYGGAERSLGPVEHTENILFVGRVADGSVRQDSETGDLTFDAISAAEVAVKRESYPIAVEHNDDADEWYKVPGLTVDLAAWHYLIWHSTIPLVCDFWSGACTREIAAMDFVAGSIYQTLDSFYRERMFGRLLCDRYERFAAPVDRQMQAAGAGVTIWALQEDDWIGQAGAQVIAAEPPTSTVDLAGVFYNDGQNDPYMAHAPGDTSRQYGKPQQATYLSVSGQAELNALAGRLLAYKNNPWPSLALSLAGNWRVADVWPQEYVSVTLATERHTFSNVLFLVRDIGFTYDAQAGALGVSIGLEYEADGADGATIPIPEEPPSFSPSPPRYGPYTPAWPGVDEGRRIVATNVGVFATNNIGQANPRWYDCNAGIPAGQERCWKIIRDPWHWWSSGGGERTLWGLFGDDTRPNEEPRYVYKMEGFPHGTWAASLDCQTLALNPNPAWEHFGIDIVGTIEVADLLYLAVQHHTAGLDTTEGWLIASPDGGGSWNDLGQFTAVGVPDTIGFPTWPGSPFRIGLANHSAASTIYIYQSYMTPGNDLCVRKSSNGGGTWNTQAPLIGPWAMDVWGGITVPYQSPTWNDRDIVVRMAQPLNDIKALQRSTDGGTSWGAIGEAVPMAYRAHSIPSSDKDTIAVLLASAGNSEIRITTDGGVSWATWATMPWLAGYCAQFEWAEGSGGAGAALKSVLVPRMDGGFEGVYLVTAGGTVSDRTGNLRGFGATSFSKIERDTMGAA